VCVKFHTNVGGKICHIFPFFAKKSLNFKGKKLFQNLPHFDLDFNLEAFFKQVLETFHHFMLNNFLMLTIDPT